MINDVELIPPIQPVGVNWSPFPVIFEGSIGRQIRPFHLKAWVTTLVLWSWLWALFDGNLIHATLGCQSKESRCTLFAILFGPPCVYIAEAWSSSTHRYLRDMRESPRVDDFINEMISEPPQITFTSENYHYK